MGFNNFNQKLIARVMLLCITLSAPVPLVIKGWSELLVFFIPLLIFQVWELINFCRKAQDELSRFIESIHYRDFSRYFNEKDASPQVRILRKGFNEISATFKSINQEKETQHQQLQKIMELVDTGIMTFNIETGEVLLINEALKKILQIPFMKSIHHLEKKDAELYNEVLSLQPGHSKIATAYTDHLEKSDLKLLLSATVFYNDGITYKLVVFQNINEALDETESKAWQKLLNVMTHEIMNSIAPISSVADTLKNRLNEIDKNGVQEHDIEDLEVGISTIKRRSEGLLKFAEIYRNLNKINKLSLQKIYLKDVFTNLQRLMQPSLEQKKIRLEIILKDPDISMQADANLLDQVLINLLLNAMDAVKEVDEPLIRLSAHVGADGKTRIKIIDNGKGMSKEVQEKIFIPFFSTRKNGNGIGLSLCKQIVMLHRGSIQVQSVEGEGTVFTLRFA